MNINRKTQDLFFYLTGLCAVAIYSIVIYQHAYNIPKWDDFPDILRFLDRWLAASSFPEKFSIFISQTNEHILLVNHLIILFQYYLIGHINFAWLIYIGNIFYIGSSLALWLFFKNHSERAFCFAIIMLCGVSFYSYESTLWAMTALSNQAVILFSFLAIYVISRPIKSIALAMLLSCLAVFSQSNGIFVLLVIGAYFYFLKDWLKLKQWSFFSVLIIGLYAYWFNPASQQNISLPSVLHQLPLQNYLLTLPAFLVYMGGSSVIKMTLFSIVVSLLLGIGIITIFFIQLKRKLYPTEILLIIAFILLSVLSIASYRGLVAGPQVAFVSRYKMYSACFLITGVLLSPVFIKKIQDSLRWKAGVLSVSLFYFAWSFPANLAEAKIIDGDLFQSLQRWVEDGDFRRGRGYFVKDADSYLFAALKNKTYTPIVLLRPEMIIKKVDLLSACPVMNESQNMQTTTEVLITHKNPNAAGIKITRQSGDQIPLSIVLCSDSHFYTFDIPFQNKTNNENDESVFYIQRENILPGTYAAWIKKSDLFYRIEVPFINKIATR